MADIYLTRGYVAQVDEDDVASVIRYRWHTHESKRRGYTTNTYARGHVNGRKVYLHRFLMNCPDSLEVDHVDGDGLNCCRDNLEVVTPKGNKKRRDKRKGRA